MDRLTERFSNGQAASYWCGSNCKYNHKYCIENVENCPALGAIFEKLCHYEEQEDAGLLLILPKGFNKEDALMALCNSDICPADFGLKGMFDNILECEERGTPCPDCWETALKGDTGYEKESD